MGNSSIQLSSSLPYYDKSHWVRLSAQFHCDIVSNTQTNLSAQLYRVPYNSNLLLADCLHRYEFRKSNKNNLVQIYQVGQESTPYLCQSQPHFIVVSQRIPLRLSSVQLVNIQQIVTLLLESFIGFKSIFEMNGPLNINDEMIGFNENGNVRVWLNQNYGQCFPNDVYQHIRQRFSEKNPQQAMILQIISLVQDKITTKKLPDRLQVALQNANNFKQATAAVQRFMKQTNIHSIQGNLLTYKPANQTSIILRSNIIDHSQHKVTSSPIRQEFKKIEPPINNRVTFQVQSRPQTPINRNNPILINPAEGQRRTLKVNRIPMVANRQTVTFQHVYPNNLETRPQRSTLVKNLPINPPQRPSYIQESNMRALQERLFRPDTYIAAKEVQGSIRPRLEFRTAQSKVDSDKGDQYIEKTLQPKTEVKGKIETMFKLRTANSIEQRNSMNDNEKLELKNLKNTLDQERHNQNKLAPILEESTSRFDSRRVQQSQEFDVKDSKAYQEFVKQYTTPKYDFGDKNYQYTDQIGTPQFSNSLYYSKDSTTQPDQTRNNYVTSIYLSKDSVAYNAQQQKHNNRYVQSISFPDEPYTINNLPEVKQKYTFPPTISYNLQDPNPKPLITDEQLRLNLLGSALPIKR